MKEFFGKIKTDDHQSKSGPWKSRLASEGDYGEVPEFALDLCRDSQPSQLVVAQIKPQKTLEETWRWLNKQISAFENSKDKDSKSYSKGLGVNDRLSVPTLFWRITHRFPEFEGKSFQNVSIHPPLNFWGEKPKKHETLRKPIKMGDETRVPRQHSGSVLANDKIR